MYFLFENPYKSLHTPDKKIKEQQHTFQETLRALIVFESEHFKFTYKQTYMEVDLCAFICMNM
jgi:hypothetical protein